MGLIKEIQKLEKEINEKMRINNVIVKFIENEDKNKGNLFIFKNKKVDKKYELEIISISQINIIENGKIIERGLFAAELEKWIFNKYNPIEYLYQFYGGELDYYTLTREQVNKIAIDITEDCSLEREKDILVHRQELDNQPIVKDYIGPMFDGIDYGKIFLRYETQEVYDMLST